MDANEEHRDSGFTLIELLVVMVILGVLASIAMLVVTEARSRAQDTAAVAVARTALTAEMAWAADDPPEGYLDLWQDTAARRVALNQIEGSTRWYDGWHGSSSPAPGAVMVAAGHTNSGTLVDDWLMLTVLSKSGACFTVSREDTPPRDAAGFTVGTYYRKDPSTGGACPGALSGLKPPSVAPTAPATGAAWGTRW